MLLVASLILFFLPALQDEAVTELHPDGSVAAEYQVTRASDGSPVRHGSYRAYHPDGSRAALGRYEEGRRQGKWREWHASGKRKSAGAYAEGLRQGTWEYWDEQGQLDPVWTGKYEILADTHASGKLRARGEARDGVRHGQWTFWWENGALRASGEYRAGRHHGEWRFGHPDGTLDPTWISGQWLEGARVGPLAGVEPTAPAALMNGGAIDTTSFPRLRLDAGLIDVQRAEGRRLLGIVAGEDAAARDAAAAELLAWGTSIVPIALESLCVLDFASAVDNRRARMIHERILTPCADGVSMGWRVGTEPEDVAANRMSALRWWSLWLSFEDDPEMRAIEWPVLVKAAIKESRPLETMHFAPSDGSPAPLGLRGFGAGPFAPRFLPVKDKDALLGKGVRVALDDGLRWLAAHQAPDGHWSAAGFGAQCGAIGPTKCDGPGEKEHDVGLTGLALLAFLADGHTTRSGAWRDTVAAGIGWLINAQDAVTGRLGERSPSFVYEHGIATLALCEALCTADSARLRWAAKRALDVVVLAQNPYAGWRYAVPPNGENDTSVTAWMMQAAWTGKLAGLTVRGDPTAGGLAWIEHVTDPVTGRVGYDAIGSLSAREVGKNDHFPREKGEAMTAAGLFCRHLAGQRASAVAVMNRHADLLVQRLPTWDPAGLGIDLYYWFYGSQALWQHQGLAWEKWHKTLTSALLEGQRRDGDERGSWDTVSVWSHAGGRIGTTALALLALEAPIRLALGE